MSLQGRKVASSALDIDPEIPHHLANRSDLDLVLPVTALRETAINAITEANPDRCFFKINSWLGAHDSSMSRTRSNGTSPNDVIASYAASAIGGSSARGCTAFFRRTTSTHRGDSADSFFSSAVTRPARTSSTASSQ